MSLIRLNDTHIERFELTANPKRTFSSSSISGTTGSIALFADNSTAVRDVLTTNKASGYFSDETIESARSTADTKITSGVAGYAAISHYLDVVNSTAQSVRANKRQEVIRSKPGAKVNKNFAKKWTIKGSLFPYYKNIYPTLDWAFTNYNCINFFTGSGVPTDSVIIYPAGTGTIKDENKNYYAPDTGFTFDFYINPRYTIEKEGEPFHAGTVLHMSSCYAVSLVTGSSLGVDGKPDAFRMMLQLSHSADVPPSKVTLTNSATSSFATPLNVRSDLIFASKDNSLKLNNWHHVAVRWGGSEYQGGTGSFVIDGVENSTFEIPSSSIMQTTMSIGYGDPDALFLGNFYEGTNIGSNQIASFFNSTAATNEGVTLFNSSLTSDPTSYTFNHPLNAEIHEVKIYDHYRTSKQINKTRATGSILESGLIFYVPPFFTKESKTRNVMQTPFFDSRGLTEDPFNIPLSFGLGGLSINLENYMRDFAKKQYPRLLNLTSSTINTQFSEEGRDANYLLYLASSHRKRNLTVIPCDNGKFLPNFDLVASGAQAAFPLSGSAEDRFVDFYGNRNTQLISLENMVGVGGTNTLSITNDPTGSFMEGLTCGDPNHIDPSVQRGNILTILQRTKDPSSNEIAIFDISNMFYGDRIKPNTFSIKDTLVTGSGGRVTFTVKDDGRGSLYRADSQSPHAKWSNVGNVLYEEGLVVIKTPHFPLFGKDAFEVTFEGERSVYVLEVTVPAERSALNHSQNPAYTNLKPTDYDSELANKFSYLTGMQLHDENLNVIMRTNFAQPVIKRDEDRFVVRARLDF